MSKASNTKIDLKEIADYRGNLSFAEENNPIPFDIKSVLWSTINENTSLTLEAQSFLIVLNGELEVNGVILDRPKQAYLTDKNTSIDLKLISSEAIILLVMDTPIGQQDASISMDNNILQTPFTNDFHGLKGNFANSNSTVPFDIKRVYFTYDIPEFAERGGHAHKELKSIIFPVKGEFDVILDDNSEKSTTHLDKINTGLNIKPGLWRDLKHFTKNSILMVLASERYCECDYIRKRENFELTASRQKATV